MLQKINIIIILFVIILPSMANALPVDVVQFMERRDLCDHFRGEYPDPESWGTEYQARLDEVDHGLRENCTGTDKALINLREKYQQQPTIIDKLKGYESCIEPTSCRK